MFYKDCLSAIYLVQVSVIKGFYNIPKILLHRILHRYKGKKFTISKPDSCTMKVSKDGFTAKLTIHQATKMYRESLDGWGSDHNTLKSALHSACQRILEKAAQPPPDALCKGMDQFYHDL